MCFYIHTHTTCLQRCWFLMIVHLLKHENPHALNASNMMRLNRFKSSRRDVSLRDEGALSGTKAACSSVFPSKHCPGPLKFPFGSIATRATREMEKNREWCCPNYQWACSQRAWACLAAWIIYSSTLLCSFIWSICLPGWDDGLMKLMLPKKKKKWGPFPLFALLLLHLGLVVSVQVKERPLAAKTSD